MRQFIRNPATDKGQRHQADCKRNIEEIKFPVRRSMELTATTKRRKSTERDYSIKARLAKGKEQARRMMVAKNKANLLTAMDNYNMINHANLTI